MYFLLRIVTYDSGISPSTPVTNTTADGKNTHSSYVQRARLEPLVLLLRSILSLRIFDVLATRPHSAMLIRRTSSLNFSQCNGQPHTRSMENSVRNYGNSPGRNSSDVSLTRFRSLCLDISYGSVSHGSLSIIIR